jgi:hypothetical protein
MDLGHGVVSVLECLLDRALEVGQVQWLVEHYPPVSAGALSVSATCQPLIPGIARSVRTRSYGAASKSASAFAPSPADIGS